MRKLGIKGTVGLVLMITAIIMMAAFILGTIVIYWLGT